MTRSADEGQRVSDAMLKTVQELDVKYLRKLQGDMHRCAAKCCDNDRYSMEKVHGCVEDCSLTLNKAQSYVQSQFENLQNRLNRCMMQCNDDVRDKMGPNPSEVEVSKFTREFDSCAKSCVDQLVDVKLPALMLRIQQVLESKTFPTS